MTKKEKEIAELKAKTYENHLENKNNQRWSFNIVRGFAPEHVFNNPTIVEAIDNLQKETFSKTINLIIQILQI
jgi:hypothetical protein